MQTFVKNEALNRRVQYLKKNNQIIGFCPTMGALHSGHLSLVEHSMMHCDATIVSIFVNPTQFNEASDLVKYPKPIKKDKALLKKAGLDIIYVPGTDQIYPPGLNTNVEVDLAGLDRKLEGAFRPGHFAGVVQVVKRLLDIVQPDKLFMGQKDFQQFTIIGQMIRELKLPVELVVVPIKREKDGLAMSSRNVRLTSQFRKSALVLYKCLQDAKMKLNSVEINKIKTSALTAIQNAGLKPEYFDLVDGYTLDPIKNTDESDYIVALTAAWAGDVRLIDNEIIKMI